MTISPDEILFGTLGPIRFTATLVFTWVVMALLVVVSALVTRHVSDGTAPSRIGSLLEVIVEGMRGQIREATRRDPDRYLAFAGTLFLFIAVSNVLTVIPGFSAPTGSLSTTFALAVCVFVAVPVFGIRQVGLKQYLLGYARPTPLMLPFNLISEVTRTLALAVRLFGNIMSGGMIAATLLAVAPLILPVLLEVLGLLTGLVQAYIFSILALVYVASAEQAHEEIASRNSLGKRGENSDG